jgi:drug/metabolite transporter (DMT)-like permease
VSARRSSLVFAFVTIYLVWGSTYLGIRVAVGSIPPFMMAALRFFVAGALLLAFLRSRGPLDLKPHQWRDGTIAGTFLLLGGNGLISWAEQAVPSGITSLIVGLQPLAIMLTEWAWRGGRRPGPRLASALLLGFLGIVWLAAPWNRHDGGAINLTGVLAILLAVVFWAVGSLYSKNSHDPAPPLVSAGLQMFCASVPLALTSLLCGEWGGFQVRQVSLHSWLALGYLVVFGSLLGFCSFVWLLKHSTPAKVATYAYVNPVVAVFLGWLILDEPVGARVLSASVMILAAVVLVTLGKAGDRTA